MPRVAINYVIMGVINFYEAIILYTEIIIHIKITWKMTIRCRQYWVSQSELRMIKRGNFTNNGFGKFLSERFFCTGHDTHDVEIIYMIKNIRINVNLYNNFFNADFEINSIVADKLAK